MYWHDISYKVPVFAGKITIICTDNYECKDLFYNKVPPEQNCNATQIYNNPFTITQRWTGIILLQTEIIDFRVVDGK